MRQSIINKGVEVPEDVMIEDLPEYIAQIGTGESWDPENPTLEGLKYAINNDIDVAVGTEIPDTYDGNDNPLIVAQKLDSSNNSAYDGALGVILIRKYVEPISQEFGSSSDYNASVIKNFLDTTCYDNCSDSLKTVAADINIPYYNGSSMTTVTGKLFPMSAYEVCNQGNNDTEGIMWDLWKQKTGLSSPDAMSANNSGRIMRDRDGTARNVWLRTRYSSSRVCNVYTGGSVGTTTLNYNFGVLPACFIAKGGN